MKKFTFLILLVVFILLISCAFTETLVIEEDGSGRMSILMDASEAMSFGGGPFQEDGAVAIDSVISFREMLFAKKDSIALLSLEEQDLLKKMEDYHLRLIINPEKQVYMYDVFVNFKNIAEANNLFQGLDQADILSGNTSMGQEIPQKEESIKVAFSFENNVFKRDAYIVDKAAHQRELDSLINMEMILEGVIYKLHYTFPKPIKTTSQNTATFSLDRKTLFYEASFMAFMKNPDVLDIEVVLEN
ncbi:MAG: hypothetical protein H0X63_02215 [Flavobacteriales bacterium]|jgi:hypothetical protein|nr:hypothetical protein [Flavobacteriales bacterium]